MLKTILPSFHISENSKVMKTTRIEITPVFDTRDLVFESLLRLIQINGNQNWFAKKHTDEVSLWIGRVNLKTELWGEYSYVAASS